MFSWRNKKYTRKECLVWSYVFSVAIIINLMHDSLHVYFILRNTKTIQIYSQLLIYMQFYELNCFTIIKYWSSFLLPFTSSVAFLFCVNLVGYCQADNTKWLMHRSFKTTASTPSRAHPGSHRDREVDSEGKVKFFSCSKIIAKISADKSTCSESQEPSTKNRYCTIIKSLKCRALSGALEDEMLQSRLLRYGRLVEGVITNYW